ncbi:hypothetical protein TCAL_14655 [Tigriopus californicus]|uniref:Uncharacterized protein n=1 Tax=Tigriopus californicus TaxID=6832 RepID=A0A553P710_TIGCA|nr:hypothetical protein TCAL_14655 [Tigriopus californicus]
MFHLDLAQATPLLWSLLKKGTAFQWMPAHQAEFDNTKSASLQTISSKLTLLAFGVASILASNLPSIRDAAQADDKYTTVINAITSEHIPDNAVAQSLTSVWPRVSVEASWSLTAIA